MWIINLFRNWVRTGVLLGFKDALDELENINVVKDDATPAELHIRIGGRSAPPPQEALPAPKPEASPKRDNGRRGKDAA